ncbi:phosphate ABC transporter permease PstA [Asticcacaulis excentricus]|uniref:Phosphate transport system permease protein PstA n=1 Tax=Asticcacaulis excentricus TaxID=78587 RepID=A0A3G9GAY7_9CAUL|nr:phosphate ABC transporter permease PstA [Asticcacaulis excentricus]BBF81679.1 phosphate transport system permease protein PstA [Asticcacaulis excentricus]
MDRALRRKIANQAFVIICTGAALVALAALALIMFSLLTKGVGGVDLMLFTADTPAPDSPGGLRNAIIGSILMCGVAMMIAVVIGVLAGTWLAEIGGNTPYGHVVRFLNDVLLSAPSILIGLFVYWWVVVPMGGFSGWAGAIALGIIATPIVTRTTEDILNLQPNALREAGMALGASQWVTVRSIIWKAAGAGMLTGGLLGFARISGETAPLLFTALNNQFLSFDMSKPFASLPGAIYPFAMSPYETWNTLAWAGALLITLAVLGVNILGRWLARDKDHK